MAESVLGLTVANPARTGTTLRPGTPGLSWAKSEVWCGWSIDSAVTQGCSADDDEKMKGPHATVYF
jgi:hypothetical protein